MDLRWEYNNVWIKKEDKWKAVFTIPEGSFEPIVIFFRLTNSPTTFQTIMNKILWNLINMEKVVSFIDNIIIRTEGEEKYVKIIEEVVKRLIENDLYVKPEKCK